MVIAPFVEEFFFRGFLYGALRGRFGVLTAAGFNGMLFGAVHYSGPDSLSILPPPGQLGVLFCLLYEQTGSIYPAVAFHAINDTIALAAQTGTDGALAAGAAGTVTITACLLLPRGQLQGAPRLFARA